MRQHFDNCSQHFGLLRFGARPPSLSDETELFNSYGVFSNLISISNYFKILLFKVLFYIAHWRTYITGTLCFGKFDVTEAQICIIFIHLFSFLFGMEAWQTSVLGVQLWFLMASFSLCTAFIVLLNFCRVFSQGGSGKNGSTVAGTSILSPVLPFLLVIIPCFIISEKSRSGIYTDHPVLYMLTFGLLAAKVSCRLVVAHMSKSELGYLDSGLFGALILFLNQYFNEFFSEYFVLWVAFFWVTFDLVWYCSNVCLEMCDFLQIQLFRIPFPPPKTIKSANVASKRSN